MKSPTVFKRDRTSRGFRVYQFKDFYGSECSVQESSMALCEPPGSGALWVGVDIPFDGKVGTRMHLDYKAVGRLHEILGKWLEKGRL